MKTKLKTGMNKRKPGGGRKLKYGENLNRIVFYIPESKVNEIKTLVKEKLISYEQQFKL